MGSFSTRVESRAMNLREKRLLIVKPSSLGDVVHALPVAHAIKRHHPSCHIGWIVQKSFAALLEGDPAVDEILPIFIPSTSDPMAGRGSFFRAAVATVSTLKQLRKIFRDRPYDVVLDMHASFRSGLLETTNPNGFRIGFSDAKELNTLFQHQRLTPDPRKPHAVDKNLAFAEFLRCPPAPEDFRVMTSQEARGKVRAFLNEEGVSDHTKMIYANPAARWKTKLWTVEAWSELADLFVTKMGATVVFSGSPDDMAHIASITKRMTQKAVTAAGKLGLAEAVALIELSDVYVGVDSGPMHIAAFSGTPVVALFGPTDPAKVGPYGQGHRIIRREELGCMACRKRACDNRICLEGITAQHVFDETVRLLGW